MAAHHPHETWEDRFAAQFARAGSYASITSAIILTLVLIANGCIILLNLALALLLALARIGPVISSAVGLIGTAATHYGRFRILRGKEKFSLKDAAIDQALDMPGNLQDIPNQVRRLGCFANMGLLSLIASLVLWLLTAGPQPWAVLGYGQNGGFRPVTIYVTTTPRTASTPLPPTATSVPPTATTIPPTATPVVRFTVKPVNMTDSCPGALASPYSITLDNTGSSIAISWQATVPDTLTRSGNPWATVSVSQGTIPAGQTATVLVTPNNKDSVCNDAYFHNRQLAYHIVFTLTNGGNGTQIATDTITYSPLT